MVHLWIQGGAANVNPQEDHPREIVGVVGDVRHFGPTSEPTPVMYASYRQHMTTYAGGWYVGQLWNSFTARMAGDPLADIQTLERRVSESLGSVMFPMRLFAVFAALALTLAAVGNYGVMSYLVTRQTHEIGIRVALGARRGDVLRMVIGRGMRIALIGLAAGLGGSLMLAPLIAAMLFGTTPVDLPTYAVVSALLLAVALAACYLPARRALRVDPLVALRNG